MQAGDDDRRKTPFEGRGPLSSRLVGTFEGLPVVIVIVIVVVLVERRAKVRRVVSRLPPGASRSSWLAGIHRTAMVRGRGGGGICTARRTYCTDMQPGTTKARVILTWNYVGGLRRACVRQSSRAARNPVPTTVEQCVGAGSSVPGTFA